MTEAFKQTDIGLIPDDWELIPLEDEKYFESINGLWKGKKHPFKEVTVIRNTNFTQSGLIDYSDVAVLDVEEKQYKSRKLFPGDIIIERSGGGPTQPVGRVVFFDRTTGEYSFSNFTSCLRTLNHNKFLPKYVFYSLLNFYLSGKTDSLQARTTGIRNLNFTSYKEKAGVPKLTLPEQKKIAYVLSKIQQAIEIQEQIIKTTLELKKALMQKLFTEGLNSEPQKETEIGLIPQSWEVVSLSELFECEDSKRIPIKKSERKSGAYPYYGASGIADYIDEYIFSGKYLLIAEDGENLESRKLSIAFIANGKFWVNNHAHILSSNKVILEFYEEYINQMKIDDYLTGTTRPKLNQSMLLSIKLPFPSYKQQEKIARRFVTLREKIANETNKYFLFRDFFNSTLNQLMTGQIRVREI